MIRRPFAAEWDTSQLTEDRRAYLDSGLSFEEMISQLLSETTVISATICPYRDPAPGEKTKNARQVVFLVGIGKETCDLLYNAPDGLRGRYWQSPDHGSAATRYLISTLMPSLLAFADEAPPNITDDAAPMTIEDIRESLGAPSAKVWPWEGKDRERLLIEHQLMVPRWRDSEARGPSKVLWRRDLRGEELQIKGAILDLDRTEYIPEGKRSRSCQIFQFGFT
jgi:hypothetical protein